MASLSNINGLFDVHSTGAILFSTSHGTSGQILKSNGNAAPTWVAASTVIGGPYLPLTGGTLSGPLSGTSATFTGKATFSDKIQIGSFISNDYAFTLKAASVATLPLAVFEDTASANGNGIVVNSVNTPNNYIADFKIGNVSKVKINKDGGIDVAGNQITVDPASGDAILQLQSSTQTLRIDQNSIRTGTNNNLALFTNGNSNQLVLKQSNGFVGIGTNSPAAKLSVVGSGENGGIFFGNSGAQEHRFYASANSQFNTIGSSTPIWNWAQYTGVGVTPNYKMTLNSTGLGIGETSPSSKLDVVGTNTSSNPLVELTASGTGLYQRGVRLLNGGMSAPSSIMYALGYADNARNMGQTYFHYAGSGSTSNRLSMGLHSVDDVFNILGTGKVGIGTTTPAGKLHIHQTGSGTSNTIITEDDARKIFIGRDSIKATDLNNNAQILHLQQNGGDAVFGGGIYLGGTATANKLDDYEEGTWTPAVQGSGTAGTVTYGSQGGSYTKIGNKVTCWFSITNFTQSGASGNFTITGLPFTCITTSAVRGCFSSNLRFYNMPFPGDVPVISLSDNNTSFIILWSRNNATWIGQAVANTGNQYIEGYVTYSTA